jgi:hypothetical protein
LQAEPLVEELTQIFKAFKQYMKKEGGKGVTSMERPPLVCYYCHCENHRTARCQEPVKDKEAGLVEQRGSNFFLPNGALIPFNRSRPIRHVVASFQPSPSSGQPPAQTPTRQASTLATTEYKTSCGALQPWYPPAISLQSFASAYEADPAGRKQHKESKPYKAPLVPASKAKRPARKVLEAQAEASKDNTELFDRIMNNPEPLQLPSKEPCSRPVTPPKPSASPKVRFERGVS